MKIKIICSWCGCFMGWKEGDFSTLDETQPPITHSICPKCFEKEMAKIKADNKPNK